MTKKYFTRLLQTSLMCCLAVFFTACDDYFGSESNPTPAYLSMSDKPVTIKVGETFLRQATAATVVIEYSSSDTKVATVDNTGLVTAIAEGETTITATATGYSSQTGKKIYLPDSKSYKLTVKPATLPAATITTPPVATTGDIIAGTATDLVEAGEAKGGTMMYLVTAANEAKPTSTDGFSADIPSASNRAAGTYSVWYYAKADDKHNNSEIAGPVAVTLVVAATSITLNKTMEVLVKNGDALTITATVAPSGASFTWESSDANVATVTNGVVTPKSLGIATITAKSGDVKATCQVFVGNEVNLSSSAYEAKNYDILKGDMGANQLTIPAGKHVAFDGLTVNGNNIKCDGTATIYLTDGSTNTVTVSTSGKAGIQIGGEGTTLTINAETAGTGTLTAKAGSEGAGIGTSMDGTGGNIVINGGTVTATGGDGAAGIGTGFTYGGSSTNKCDAITINGGWVNATGGKWGAGIGTGKANYTTSKNTCGAITIKANVTRVTAKKGDDSPNIIGNGYNGTQTCGTITFGTESVFDGSAWSPATMTNGTYGGLKLTISGNTWILFPSN